MATLITTRKAKGSELEWDEVDANFTNLQTSVDASLRKANNLSDVNDPASARANIGLGEVNNTSDDNKPVSTATAAAIQSVRDDLASDAGSSLVGYLPAGTGAVATDVQSKLRELVSLADFNKTAYHVARVPSDYPTLQAAFDALAPGVFKSGQYIEVLIETGHALTHGLELRYGDYSHFRISSESTTVSLAAGFAYVDDTYRAVMRVENARAPVWNILVDCGGQIGRALMYVETATGYITAGKGAKNATYFQNLQTPVDQGAGLYVLGGSSVSARNSVFSDNSRGAWITRGCSADLELANFDNSKFIGLYASRSSTVAFDLGSAKNCGVGIYCIRSIVIAENANLSGAINHGLPTGISGGRAVVAANTGIVSAFGANASNADSTGFSAESMGTLYARNGNASGAGSFGFSVSYGSRLDKTGGTGTVNRTENLYTRDGIITDNNISNIWNFGSGALLNYKRQRTGPSLSIADDAVAELDLTLVSSEEWGILTIASSGTGNGHPNGQIRYRVGTSPATTNISLITTTNINLTTGVLTGTTGPDGDFSISAADDGKLYFENRTGSSKSVRVFVTG